MYYFLYILSHGRIQLFISFHIKCLRILYTILLIFKGQKHPQYVCLESHPYILKAIKNATFYKAFSMQKVYMIFEAMVIKVKNFCQAHLIVKVTSIQKIAI